MFEWLIIAWLYVTGLLAMYGIKLNVSGFGHWRWWEMVFYPVYVIPAALIGMVIGMHKSKMNGHSLLNYGAGLFVSYFVLMQVLTWVAMSGAGYLLVWQFVVVCLPALAIVWLIYEFEGKDWVYGD